MPLNLSYSPHNLTTLQAGQVDVWYVFTSHITQPSVLAHYRQLLSPAETKRHQRYRFEKDRHLYLVAHAMVRLLLSTYMPLSPKAWTFTENEYGCPFIANDNPAQLHFNISHTKDCVACVIGTGRELGVDVEIRSRRAPLDVADRYFAAAEVAALHRQPRDHQSDRFFTYWTLKEAYIKARGMGLALSLGKFAFDVDVEPITISFAPDLDDEPRSWQFTQFHWGSEHLGAVAVRRPEGKSVNIVPRYFGD